MKANNKIKVDASCNNQRARPPSHQCFVSPANISYSLGQKNFIQLDRSSGTEKIKMQTAMRKHKPNAGRKERRWKIKYTMKRLKRKRKESASNNKQTKDRKPLRKHTDRSSWGAPGVMSILSATLCAGDILFRRILCM